MVFKKFLCCFSILEGSWLCAVLSVFLGVLRVLLQCFNLQYRRRMTKIQREDTPISFNAIEAITIIQLASAAVSVFVAIVMMVGLFKRVRCLLLPWMLWLVTEHFFDITIIIFYASKHVKIKGGVYIADMVAFFIAMYSVLCVYTLFRKWKWNFGSDGESRPLLNMSSDARRHENCSQEELDC